LHGGLLLPLYKSERRKIGMTNVELLNMIISIAALVLTVYFGARSQK